MNANEIETRKKCMDKKDLFGILVYGEKQFDYMLSLIFNIIRK